MKKIISILLAVLMAGLWTCGIAEETDQSENTAFLRIKEGVTAQVFAQPGDEKAVDTLPGGRICGQLGREKAEAGAVWFRVFYLDSIKTGAIGYINAEDLEQITENQMKALMEDPATLNEILDLIDAMNACLSQKDGKTENDSEAQENELKTLYEKMTDRLKNLFSSSVEAELGNLEKEGKELVNKAKEAGEALIDEAREAGGALLDEVKESGGTLLDEAKKAGEKLKDSVTDALDSLDGKDIDEKIDSLKDSITETVEGWTKDSGEKIKETLENASTALKSLDENLGESTGDSIDGFAEFMNKTKDWLNGEDFSKVNDAVNNLSDEFKGNGFTGGAGQEGVGSFLDELKTIFSTK